ncbi:GntR family transcriptional regulator [Maritalea mobilis]|uniref:GntR family transcriptional regulator n=1 Tax=Maritalea mobilis TaxID=483324 RepID=A0A4R6VZJ9_9HYPH|nr:GntR family transcriptional regulator [Maritalea mobilis]TDQ66065.1 GntR family transcriptional regulator [Maritalea mobilis]
MTGKSDKSQQQPDGETVSALSGNPVMEEILLKLQHSQKRNETFYRQLAGVLRELIERGALRGGEALPSERELVKATGFSRITVRKAIESLLNDGLISKRHGAGTFVKPQIDQPLSILLGFTADMQRRGQQSSSILLDKSVGLPTANEALKLGISPSEQVVRLSRVRLAEGEPLGIENATVPLYAAPPETIEASLYEALRQSGNMPVRAVQRMHAAIANEEESRLLGIEIGSPIFHTERHSFLANGRPIEVTMSAYRGDRYDFIAELNIEH